MRNASDNRATQDSPPTRKRQRVDGFSSARLSLRRLAHLWALLGLVAAAAVAQPAVLDLHEELDFDEPESWALKYFTSVTLLTSLAPPARIEAGKVEIGLELGWIPRLSAAERTVGFGGTKEEDLNRQSVLVRPRLTVGLGRGWSVTGAYVPPAEIKGVRGNLFSLAVERLFGSGDDRWSFAVRGHGQTGDLKGDLTCSEHDASFELGSEENLFGCVEPSNDRADLHYLGVEGVGALRFGDGKRFFFGLSANRMDLTLQVDAFTFSVHDRTRNDSQGWTYSATAGLDVPIREAIAMSVALFYSPLDVVRPPSAASDNDALLNLRAMMRYRIGARR